jgi:DNA invertase Pin-like site-specific DNA recombinase
MKALKGGDLVIVTKLDRLGRSTRELLDLIDRISKTGAAFRSLGDPLWDTSSAQGRLLSTLLAGIAEFERELIRERTGEGRKRAMAKGGEVRAVGLSAR